tara:strand:+ start:1336 stop:1470 length:135 start_codon:yes stop_codon:yes gene_type:complete
VKLESGRGFYFPYLLILSIPLNIAQIYSSQTSLVEFVFEKVEDI